MKTDSDVPPADARELARAERRPLRKLYYWTLHWAGTRYAVPALMIISFAEASFFPIPPDTLLLPMCFARPKKWASYAFWCTLTSVLGAIAGWLIGLYLWEAVKGFFFHYVFRQEAFDAMAQWYRTHGFWVILFKGLTPIPFKLITISAGACHVPLSILVIASVVSRGARFFFVAGLVRAFGEKARPFIERYLTWVLLAFFVALIGGLVTLKFLPH